MEWQPEAREKINRLPFFIRSKACKMAEEEARQLGLTTITIEHLRYCKEKMMSGGGTAQKQFTGYSVETCMGIDGCPHNLIADYDSLVSQLDKLMAKQDLAAFYRQKVGGSIKFHHRFSVVIAGCPNSCSRPQIADLGIIGALRPRIKTEPACEGCQACVDNCPDQAIMLTGSEATMAPVINEAKCLVCGQCISACQIGTISAGQQGFRLMVGGKLGRHPQLATVLPGIYDLPATIDFVSRCLNIFKQHNLRGERFGELLARIGMNAINFP